MVFACQKDSFLTEFTSTVVSCEPVEYIRAINGQNTKINCYEVVLDDTILFPEGGGQPCDYGKLNDEEVFQVLRRGAEAVHYVETPFEKGVQVKQVLNWDRRLDHMQQHSGQHLLTALAELEFGYNTTSWWLGEDTSHIELDSTKITEDEVQRLEELINKKIRDGLRVSVDVYESGDALLDESRTRGLPKDHVGSVRVVTIHGIESNMCCGTHVTNLSQLQSIKLLGLEKGKKGKTNLLFLVGNRVLRKLNTLYRRELEFNLLLKNGPEYHCDLIEKIIKSNKQLTKNLQLALRSFASLEIEKFKKNEPSPKFFAHHRKEAEMDYINFFIKEFNDPKTLLMLSIGEQDGHVVLFGPEEQVAKFGPRVSELLDGKGNGKGNRYQAKVKSLKKLDQLTREIRDVLSN